jgi:hypothetical protein
MYGLHKFHLLKGSLGYISLYLFPASEFILAQYCKIISFKQFSSIQMQFVESLDLTAKNRKRHCDQREKYFYNTFNSSCLFKKSEICSCVL